MAEQKQATDFLVECNNPESFDKTINQLGAAALIENGEKGGYHVMRVFGDPGYIKFAIQNQGYGKVIRQLDDLE
jgi:hypothetical protein